MSSVIVQPKYNATDWATYTLTIGAVTTPPTLPSGVTTNLARWKRNGSNMDIVYTLDCSNVTSGNNGSGLYKFPVPAGYTIDTSTVPASTTKYIGLVGMLRYGGGAATDTLCPLFVYDTGNMFSTPYNTSAGFGSAANIFQASSTAPKITFFASVPITGWTVYGA